MLQLNLFDNNFRHLHNDNGEYSMVHEKIPRYIRYVRDLYEYDGITIFTDQFLEKDFINRVNSKYKIGWIIECRNISPYSYENFENYMDSLDFVLTHDSYLLGGGWVTGDNFRIHNKTKMLSMIFSDKKEYEGHRLRHDVAYKFGKVGGFDLYGSGMGSRIPKKETALSDYMFTVVIENLKIENYFTEKIIDPCLVGTIPIYWGCPNIDKFLDKNGIITFNTIDELENILRNLSEDLYFNKIKNVDANLELAKNYEVTEDWIYLNILKELK